MIATGGAKEGTFYLTTDTHRLYIGRTVTADSLTPTGFTTKTIPIPVNEGILTVANVNDLPADAHANPGEFYYLSSSNILCVYNGTHWVQINPNTNTDTEINSASVSSATEYRVTEDTNLVAGKTYYTQSGSTYIAVENPTINSNPHNLGYYEPYRVKYTLTITEKQTDRNTNDALTPPANITTDFYINSSDIANVLSISAGLTRAAVSNNASEISLDGGISNGHTISLKGGTNVTLSTTEANTITINSSEYKLARGSISSDTVPIKLQKDNSDTSPVINITAGNHLSIDSTDTDGITINHDTPGSATQTGGVDDQYGETSTATKTVNGATSSSFKVPTVKKDAYGHITAISESTITLNGIQQIQTSNTDGKISFLDQLNNTGVAESAAHALSYNITVDGETQTVDNKGNLGTFYSAAGVDAKIEHVLQGANALTYKGLVGSTATGAVLTLPTENVQIGDTYLVAQNVHNIYTKTQDTTTVGTGKTYYTISGSDFVEVTVPSDSNIANYYEKVISSGVESGDLFIATGDEYAASTDTAVDATKTYYTYNSSTGVYTKVTNPTGNPSTSSYYENTGIIQDDLAWTYVPSGDDIDTQYTFGVNATTHTIHLRDTNTGNDVAGIRFISGNKISPATITSETSGSETIYKIGFNHSTVTGLTAATYGAGQTVTSGTYADTAYDSDNHNKFSIPTLTVDSYGHVTDIYTRTYTLPVVSGYLLRNAASTTSTSYDTQIRLYKDNSVAGSVTLVGDSTGGVGVTAASNGTININHATIATPANDNTLTDFTSAATAVSVSNDTLPALTALDIDSYGHVSKYKVTNYSLPAYTVYAAAVNNNIAAIALQKNNSDVATKVKLTSDNLTFTNTLVSNEQTYKINLEWGSFTDSI